MYAGANMGHPSREEGFVLCSNHSAANDKGERTRPGEICGLLFFRVT
jgi:hypothetical protein